ncbi:MAG: LysM peptidoglycan-binding domain-containing protein [Thermodesulfobacteriota bacterium]
MGFETDENQEEFEEAPRSYLRNRGGKPGGNRKFLLFALMAAGLVVLLAAGTMLLLPGGDDSAEEVSNKKTLEIGNAGDLPEAPAGGQGEAESVDARGTGLLEDQESEISDLKKSMQENHEQVMGRLAELAKRVVENNEQSRDALKMMENLEERIAGLEKQYQQYRLVAVAQSGGAEQSREDSEEKSEQESRDEGESETGGSDGGQSEYSYYTVKKNDTLYSIAKNHGMELETLLEENGLKENSVISPGDRLKVNP